MSELSGKTVKELREAYASIYSQTDENEVISEEEMIEAFVEEFANELISYLREEGLLKEDDIINEGIPLNKVLNKVWNKGSKMTTDFLSGLTGIGKGATKIPITDRVPGGPRVTLNPGTTPLSRGTQGQRRRDITNVAIGVGGAAVGNTPVGQEALRRAGQAVTGAVTGAAQGAYKGATTPSGVPYIDPKDKNKDNDGLTLPAGFEKGPDGKVRRKK